MIYNGVGAADSIPAVATMSPLFCLLLLAVLATVSSQEFVPNVPEECLKTGICENLPDYPTEHVDAIIQELGPALDKYEGEELDASETLSRAGDEDQDLCESKRRTYVPHAARDKDGKWHFVVNQMNKPVQTMVVEVKHTNSNPLNCPSVDLMPFVIRFTNCQLTVWAMICKPVDAPCANVAHFYTGYTASCKQKFVYRKSPTLNAGGGMVERQLLFPSCCSCQYRQTNE
ncbi:uncharacterized protein LOC134648303 [Cydia amplana]|uniref:uncharacterized protein LOC134648303 n=1 Tax=Cydia amplana TaxID=1869771 RepID=UPI002FE60391